MVDSAASTGWSKAAWYVFVATIVLTPFAVGTIPFSANPFMVNHTSALHSFVLCMGAALCAAIVAVALLRTQIFVRWNAACWAAVAAVVLVLISTGFSKDIWSSIGGNLNDVLSAGSWVALLLMTLLGISLIDSTARVRQLVSTFCISGFVLSCLVLLDQLFELEVFTPAKLLDQLWSVHQGGSVFGNPDFMGVFLIVPALLTIGRALRSTTARSSLCYWMSSLVISVALLRTLTRAAWLGLVLGMVILGAISFYRSRRYQQVVVLFVVAMVALGLLIAGAFSLDLKAKVNSISGEFAGAKGGRIALAAEALRVVAQDPLTGTGPANYRLTWGAVRDIPHDVSSASTLSSDAHNWLLYTAAVLGAPGALVIVVLLVFAFLGGVRDIKSRGFADDDTHAVFVALLCVLLAGFVSAIHVSVVLWTLILCAILVAPFARKVVNLRQSAALSYMVVAIVLSTTGVLVVRPYFSAAQAFRSANPGAELVAIADAVPFSASLGSYGASALAQAVSLDTQSVSDYRDVVVRLTERHPNDPALVFAAGAYLVAYGQSSQDQSVIGRGADMALRSMEIFPYYPDSVRLAVKAAFVRGNTEYALDIAREYAEVIKDDTRLSALVDQIKASQE